MQLNCDRVRRYQPEAVHAEEEVAPEPGEALVVAEETAANTVPVKGRRVVISISQTSDENRDITCLHRVIDALKDFPGQDEVSLQVTNEEKVINLRLSNIGGTGYCPELHQRLVELVGEEGLELEPSESV